MLKSILARFILTADEQALLQSLRRLSQSDRQFIRRAAEALAHHPAA